METAFTGTTFALTASPTLLVMSGATGDRSCEVPPLLDPELEAAESRWERQPELQAAPEQSIPATTSDPHAGRPLKPGQSTPGSQSHA